VTPGAHLRAVRPPASSIKKRNGGGTGYVASSYVCWRIAGRGALLATLADSG
jgi:hypothetical protein